MSLTLALTDRRSGVPLVASVIPSTPTAVRVVGQNQVAVTWSQASGGTPQEFIELRVTANGGTKQFRKATIDWGDGSPVDVRGGLGKNITQFFQHVYTAAGPFTITVTLSFFDTTPALVDTLSVTPQLSGDWAIDQVQIEKLEDDVLRYAPDWAPLDAVPASFTDQRVSRGFQYKYRIRFRTVDGKGAASVVSRYSAQAVQNAWA